MESPLEKQKQPQDIPVAALTRFCSAWMDTSIPAALGGGNKNATGPRAPVAFDRQTRNYRGKTGALSEVFSRTTTDAIVIRAPPFSR
jgi:hypothetical protein